MTSKRTTLAALGLLAVLAAVGPIDRAMLHNAPAAPAAAATLAPTAPAGPQRVALDLPVTPPTEAPAMDNDPAPGDPAPDFGPPLDPNWQPTPAHRVTPAAPTPAPARVVVADPPPAPHQVQGPSMCTDAVSCPNPANCAAAGMVYDPTIPTCVAVQLPSERIGRAITCPDGTTVLMPTPCPAAATPTTTAAPARQTP